MANRRGVLRTLAVLLLSTCIGCTDQLPTFPVNGHVKFSNGGAVHVGTVELKSRVYDVQARGQIESDGSFRLTTYQEGDGAVAGMHDCVIVQLVMSEDIARHQPSSVGVIDRRYASYASSGLTVEIVPNRSNDFVLEVSGVIQKQPENHSHKNAH